MITFKDRAEALGDFVFMFEERGLFVTADDLAPLAAAVLTPAGNTEVSLNCSMRELNARAAQLVPEYGQPVKCEHTWCTGDRRGHASLDPAEHQHASTEDRLDARSLLVGAFRREGDDPIRYHLDADTSSPLALTASELLTLAATLQARASQLADLGGAE